jgi:iron-sulfur cluster assembly accessory protein
MTPIKIFIVAVVSLLVEFSGPLALGDTPETQPSTQPAEPVIRLTEKAVREIRAAAGSQNILTYWLRVGTKPNEDGTKFTYVLDITEDTPDEAKDIVFNAGGVMIAIDHRSAAMLAGTVIDFRDNEEGRGFVFRTPSVEKE